MNVLKPLFLTLNTFIVILRILIYVFNNSLNMGYKNKDHNLKPHIWTLSLFIQIRTNSCVTIMPAFIVIHGFITFQTKYFENKLVSSRILNDYKSFWNIQSSLMNKKVHVIKIHVSLTHKHTHPQTRIYKHKLMVLSILVRGPILVKEYILGLTKYSF